jgi:hypothetical protein
MNSSLISGLAAPESSVIGSVAPQLRLAQSELTRVQSIIDDASSQLMTSFDVLREGIVQRSDNWVGTPEGQAICTAMTALQFQDMVGQLMSGVSNRIHVAAQLLDAPEVAGATDGASPAAGFPREVVAQKDITVGDIELF